MKIKTVLSGARGLLSLGILIGVSYEIIKDILLNRKDKKVHNT